METVPGTDYHLIEHLDFAEVFPCEHSQHKGDAPATYYVEYSHKTCGFSNKYLCCIPCWEYMVLGMKTNPTAVCGRADGTNGCQNIDRIENFTLTKLHALV